jgi:hypothetical protein
MSATPPKIPPRVRKQQGKVVKKRGRQNGTGEYAGLPHSSRKGECDALPGANGKFVLKSLAKPIFGDLWEEVS